MTKRFVSRTQDVLNVTGYAMTGAACLSASMSTPGFSKFVGGIHSSSSTLAAASGVRVYQSIDGGVNWDILSASDALAVGVAQSYDIDIVGDYIKVVVTNGATAASVRSHFYLRP